MVLALNPTFPPKILPKNNTSINNGDSIGHHHTRILSYLNQCTDMSQLKEVHAYTLRTTSSRDSKTLFLYSRILHFSSLSDLEYAYRVFDLIENPSSFMWNTLIRACAHNIARKEEAVTRYKTMLDKGSAGPDKHTFPFVLKACAYLFALSEGKQVHCQILKHGFGTDVYVNNGLIHLYGSCGCLDLAQKVFDEMPERTLVSWNTMVDALVQFGDYESALKLFREMQKVFEPDGYTMQSIITACAGLGALSLGIWAHASLLRNCDFDVATEVLVRNSLMDMYCKCGSLKMAEQIFEGMNKRDLTSWNTMILGFSMHGKANESLDYFTRMVKTETFKPNSITFVGVLSACNHRGMVREGQEYFDIMVREYSIKPELEHYGCMIDLLARAGSINEALDLVSSMPMKPDAVIWRSLLDACSKKGASVELSEKMAKQILESSSECNGSGVYVLLSRVYASARRWNDVGLIRKLMTDQGITKEPGCSSIEINGISHEFFAGDTSHPETKRIYQTLNMIDERLKSAGYSPDHSQAPLVDELNEGKGNSLRLHSERLAIAYGLINSEPRIPIRVFKNLRVCNDCHEVSKLISKIFDVEIIVRDRVRFHHFKDGCCSCSDYW